MPVTHSTRAHAKLSPSSAHRWFECPGSIRLSANIESKSSVFADEGTAAHELCQHCLMTEADATQFVGTFIDIQGATDVEKFVTKKTGKRCFEVTDEMAESVQLYLDTVRPISVGADYEVEARLDLRHIPGMDFGTGDFVAYNAGTKELTICDFKYGKGVPVEVEGNEQLLVYAEGTARRYHNRGLDKVTMIVVQPRCPHPAGSVRKWTIDAVDLVEFRFTLTEKAQETLGDGAPLKAGTWCKWCPAAVNCPAQNAFINETAESEFSEDPPVVADMTPERMAVVLTRASVIEDWLKRVKQRAHEIAMADGLPGYKFVRSTSHRKWKDEDAAVKFMAGILDLADDDIYAEPKVRSPAQIEKVLGAKRKKEIADLIHKPPGKIILAPESDPREPVKPDAEEEFAE